MEELNNVLIINPYTLLSIIFKEKNVEKYVGKKKEKKII